MHFSLSPSITISSTSHNTAQVATPPHAAARARDTCGVDARSRWAQGGERAEARPDARARGGRRGLRPVRRHTRLPAHFPARSAKGAEQKGDCYPGTATYTVATMQAGSPRAAGWEPESREPDSEAPPARLPRTYLRTRVRGESDARGEVIPRERGRKGTSPGPRAGRRTREGAARTRELPGAARRPDPG